VKRGAYILSEAEGGSPDVVLVATGSEVAVALDAKRILGQRGCVARVVSMPSIEIFDAQPKSYRMSVLPSDAHIVAIEAGRSDGWYRWVGRNGLVIGIDRFGASAPYKVLAQKFGFTGQQVAENVLAYMHRVRM
jgi:transketolase